MTDQLMTLIQDGIGLILQIAALAAFVVLHNFKNKIQSYYTSKVTQQQRQLLAQIGREAFSFAETVYRQQDGPAKLNEAIKYLLDRAKEQGLGDVPMMDARAVIETAWLECGKGSNTQASPSGVVGEPGVGSKVVG